ncbi:coiled-coil domain-containing protein 40-like isoform X2 [Clarias gariepinus]|uniref:coiled-coil domain-containing protein 40-like isoform X2 n=1 Tax=Clarias gariepinus TaxID=13013 RepID=UPI00234D922C|nr:coiled-coil domain-containing protein 40-like isoform X2 [Clarias gariepinus]
MDGAEPGMDEGRRRSPLDEPEEPGGGAEQHSGSVPEPPASSLHTTPGSNPRAALAGGEGEGRAPPGRDGEDDEDDEDELIVLDAEHPLMRRFQSALKQHLTRELENLELKLREKVTEERVENSRREELGVRLYGVQQDLARAQASLESQHASRAEAIIQRRQVKEQLENIRNQYNSAVEQAGKQRAQVSQLQSEADVLARRLRYMEELASDRRSDVSAMKNAKTKAQAEKRQAAQQKYQQDLYVERLTKQVEKLTEQISLYEVQTRTQTSHKHAAQDALAEAQLELDSMIVERKQLLQQWNSIVMGMRKRDEAYTTLQEALRSAYDQVRALDTEVEGCRRSITREQERNEALTLLVNRAERDGATYRKLLAQINAQQEALQSAYTTHTRTLQETEKSLNRVTSDCNVHQSELSVLRKQIEKESSVRLELEEKIMKKMQEQLIHNNAAKHTHYLSTKITAQLREKDVRLSKVENEVAALALEVSEVALRFEALSRLQTELQQEVTKRNQLVSANEAAVDKLLLTVEQKQSAIHMCNKKIEQIRANTGHEDLGPLELEVRSLNKQLEELGFEMKEQQHFWLWQQGELVRLNQEKQAQSDATLTLNTQFTILEQRNLRKKREMEQEERALVEMERHTKVLRLDMQKLNSLLNQNKHLGQELEQNNILMENSFIHTLKDAERESVEMQLRLEKLQEEKERLMNSLVEAERQIMLWERKVQLALETRSAVDSEVGKGEIDTMKTEVHRMERHYSQLMKQQERMLREMEAAVARRENIMTRGEAQTRSSRKQVTHTELRSTLQHLRRNILQTQKRAEECNGVINQLQQDQSSLTESLREKQLQINDLQKISSAHNDDLSNMQETREKNLLQLLALQARVKQLQAVKEDRYKATASEEDALSLITQTQQEQLRLVSEVLQRVLQDVPQHKSLLSRISLLLSAHTHSSPETK